MSIVMLEWFCEFLESVKFESGSGSGKGVKIKCYCTSWIMSGS